MVAADDLQAQQAQLVVGNLSNGFYFADEKIVLITEHEIYHKKIKRRIRRSNISNAERLKTTMNCQKVIMWFTMFMVLVNFF